MEWTNDRTELLRGLWLQGRTASQIAAQLGGVTRNAVIGKAHRLGLSSRPSPIRHGFGGERAPTPRLSEPAAAAPTEHRPAPQQRPAAAGGRACLWPVGDPKQPDFHFCGGEIEPGRSYCPTHCAIAYHRKTEAAA
jgi:GcrA cell cycle regulator